MELKNLVLGVALGIISASVVLGILRRYIGTYLPLPPEEVYA
ncbi:MAG: hypothetical protein QW622_03375 [Candidatus Pacearchaeota archaeon]